MPKHEQFSMYCPQSASRGGAQFPTLYAREGPTTTQAPGKSFLVKEQPKDDHDQRNGWLSFQNESAHCVSSPAPFSDLYQYWQSYHEETIRDLLTGGKQSR